MLHIYLIYTLIGKPVMLTKGECTEYYGSQPAHALKARLTRIWGEGDGTTSIGSNNHTRSEIYTYWTCTRKLAWKQACFSIITMFNIALTGKTSTKRKIDQTFNIANWAAWALHVISMPLQQKAKTAISLKTLVVWYCWYGSTQDRLQFYKL